MTDYLSIVPVQHPFEFNQDAAGRVLFSFNVECETDGQATAFEDEILKVLRDAGVVTALGTDAFIGSKATPSGAGPFVHILRTSGIGPRYAHATTNAATYERPSAQIVVRALDYETARIKSEAAFRALSVFNTTVTA